MIKRGRISVLMLLLAIAFVFSFSFNQKAKAENGRVDLTYEGYEGITPKQISYIDYSLFITIDYNSIEFDTSEEGMIWFVSGDSNGTIWINIESNKGEAKSEIFWASYELEGSEMSLHYFCQGYLHDSTYPYVGTYVTYTSDEEFNLPNLDELSNLSIPILPEAIQTKIASLIQQSFEYKAQSKQLLEDAKRMVESEIEKN